MRLRLLAATATLTLLAACDAQDGVQVANGANAAANATATANASAPTKSPLGAPVSGDLAKKVMRDREEGMEDIGDAFKVISREMKAPAPNLAAVRENSAGIARLAPQVTGWFPPGTDPTVGKTRAKPEIWQKPEDFVAKARDFQQAVQVFNAAAQSGDVAAMKSAHADLGKSCKACHDSYRAPEKDR